MRTFATTAALAVCSATLAAPLATTDAVASVTTDADVATTTPIKHLVVIFQENVSFDHYFGTYPAARQPARRAARSRARPDTPVREQPARLPQRTRLRNNPNRQPFRLDRTQFVHLRPGPRLHAPSRRPPTAG